MQWIDVKDKMPEDNEKVLAVFKYKKGEVYNLSASGWFADSVYSCRVDEGRFVMEPYGPSLPATHWMPMPALPEWRDSDAVD